MKTEITAFDLHFLARELKSLQGERLDKTYVLEGRSILLTFGNKTMIQAMPNRIWLPLTKPLAPDKIHPFAAQLRRLIGNSKVMGAEQVRSERILALRVARSEKMFVLYLELFSRGNAVLCDAQGIVIAALAHNDRVKKGSEYGLPEVTDTFNMSEQDFAIAFSQSTDNVSKTLAVQFGLGRVLAEELCVRTGVSGTDKATPDHARDIYPELHKMLEQEAAPQLIFEDSRLIDAVPVPFQCYAGRKRENTKNFGQALARLFALPADAVREQKLAPLQQQMKKTDTMIQMQQQRIAELEQKSAEERRKGEYIYEHYQEIKQFLAEIIEAKRTLGWREIKQKFPNVKKINEATGEIVIEL
jgi:predicted ribosome quality control (RQC) complex YloA/Tae2 family protein